MLSVLSRLLYYVLYTSLRQHCRQEWDLLKGRTPRPVSAVGPGSRSGCRSCSYNNAVHRYDGGKSGHRDTINWKGLEKSPFFDCQARRRRRGSLRFLNRRVFMLFAVLLRGRLSIEGRVSVGYGGVRMERYGRLAVLE